MAPQSRHGISAFYCEIIAVKLLAAVKVGSSLNIFSTKKLSRIRPFISTTKTQSRGHTQYGDFIIYGEGADGDDSIGCQSLRFANDFMFTIRRYPRFIGRLLAGLTTAHAWLDNEFWIHDY